MSAAQGRRRRLPERRQVHARQPPLRRPARRWCTSRPASRATARRSRPTGTAAGSCSSTPAGWTSPRRTTWPRRVRTPGARRARRGRRRRARGRRARRAAARATPSWPTSCAGGRVPVIVAANKVDERRPGGPGRRVLRRSASASRCRSRPPRASAPATCSTRSRRACPRRGEPRRTRRCALAVIGRPNVGKSSLVNKLLGEERVIVTRRGGHHARLDRHPHRDRRPPGDAGGHRRAAAADQGRRHGRLLRPAALRAGGRARRRGDRGLRRLRGRHHARTCGSPTWRCRSTAPR